MPSFSQPSLLGLWTETNNFIYRERLEQHLYSGRRLMRANCLTHPMGNPCGAWALPRGQAACFYLSLWVPGTQHVGRVPSTEKVV